MPILEAKNLTKKFGDFTAVDNVSFELREGEILGLLGPNGAGKTTTLQMLLGVLTVTTGEISYFGKSLFTHREEILQHVNFYSTYVNLPEWLTVKENLTFISYLYDISDRKKRIEKISEIFNLGSLLNKKVSRLSAGQKTRVGLAKALINMPKVLLLDEPTASLDPEVAKYIREFLLKEREQFNVSVLITSHNMAEVEELCDRVIFIKDGKIVADDTPVNLARTISVSHVGLLASRDRDRLVDFCRQNGLRYEAEGRYVTVDVKETEIPNFLKNIGGAGIDYDEISIARPTLEDYFLEMAGKSKEVPHDLA